MTQLADFTAPEVGAVTSFYRDNGRQQLAEKLQDPSSPLLLSKNCGPCTVSAMHLKYILCQIKPDRDSLRYVRRHDKLALWRQEELAPLVSQEGLLDDHSID